MIKNCRIEERTSKAGKTYKVLVITFSNGYEKAVFLENAEIYMIEQLTNR